MKTSQQWWDEVKNDSDKFNDWLVKQYRGEVTAASRIFAVMVHFDVSKPAKKVLTKIAEQESMHAEWIRELLNARGLKATMDFAEDRYWAEVLPGAIDFETAAAVGAHAEQMRLERINVIVEDKDTPEDIRHTFEKILKQEIFHASAFAKLAGVDAMAKTKYSHEQGLALLGLVI